MLTATTKSLLSPIADAVSQLIVITAQAELNGSPIPDLRDVAQLVAQHVYSLAEIGHGLIDPAALAAETRGTVDVTKLLKEMMDACVEVRAAGDLLVAVTQTLASDPFSAAGRKQLVEATKGILQGTQRILNTYDDSEIQKSLVVARALVDQSKIMTGILTTDLDAPPAVKSLLENARTFAQQSVFLFHLVHARIPELLSPPLQRALTHHSSALDRSAVGTIAALKFALAGSQQIKEANVNLVKRQLKVHACACEGIIQYIVKDDMTESALDDIVEEEEEAQEGLEQVGSGTAASMSMTSASRRSLVTASKARIDPVRACIKRYIHALESVAEVDELEQASADAASAVQQAQTDIQAAPWSKTNKQPQLTANLLAHAIQEAQGAPSDLRELHAKRVQGITDHLAKQVEMAAVTSQHEAIGAVLNYLDQVSVCAKDLDALATKSRSEDGGNGISDPEAMEDKADELQVAGHAAVQGLRALGLVQAANQIQGSVPTVVNVARSTAESAEDPTAQEASQAYLTHVVGELVDQVEESREQVVKSVTGDEVVLGLVAHIADKLQAIEAARAQGAAHGDIDRAGASAKKLTSAILDSGAIAQFLADASSVSKDLRVLDLSETAANLELSAQALADSANALLEAKATQDAGRIQAAQALLDASIRNWNATLANSRQVVGHKANTDSVLDELELCKDKAVSLGGASKDGFADADQDFARAIGNACHVLTELVNLPAHADELVTLAARVSLTCRVAADAIVGDAERFKALATQRNTAINQLNTAIDKTATHLAASARERALGSAILHIDQANTTAPALSPAANGGAVNPIALHQFMHEATSAVYNLEAAGALGPSLELDTAVSDVRNAVRDLQANDGDASPRAHNFAISRLNVALEQWAATADKVRKQAVNQVYQTRAQQAVVELDAAQTSLVSLSSGGGENAFKQGAIVTARALNDIGHTEEAAELKERAKGIVEAIRELAAAKASGNQEAEAAAEVNLQRLVRDWNQVISKAQEGAKVANSDEKVLDALEAKAIEASQSQPTQPSEMGHLDRSQLLANGIGSSPHLDAAITDFTQASKSAMEDLNRLDCSGSTHVLASASSDVEVAGQGLLAAVAAHGIESVHASAARKSLTFAVDRYNDASGKVRSHVDQRQASKRLASTLVHNKKASQRLSKATDLEAIEEAADEFCQSANSLALTLRGLGCGQAAHQLASLAPLVIASTRQAATPSADPAARARRDALADQWNAMLARVEEETDGVQAQAQLGSALAALGHVKAAALELLSTNETRASADKFALAAQELDASLRDNPALVGAADQLISATEGVMTAARAVSELELKGQVGTPAHAAAKANLDRAFKQWTAVATKAHDELAASAHQVAKSNANTLIESAHVSADGLAAVAEQNGTAAASVFNQTAQGAIQSLQALGLSEAAGTVQKVMPPVLEAIQAVASEAERGDTAAQQAAAQQLAIAAAEWNKTLDQSKEAVVAALPSQAVLSGLTAQAVHTAQGMNRVLQTAHQYSATANSTASLRTNVNKLAQVISGLVKAIQHEADNTDDLAYKSKLQSALANVPTAPSGIHKVQGFILDCATLVANHGGTASPALGPSVSASPPVPSDLLTLIRASVKQLDNTSAMDGEEQVEFKSAASIVPVTVHTPISDSLANLAAEDVVIVEEEAPELLPEEEAKENPIKAVAQELIVQASRWSHQDNDLVATVTNVSQRLHDLAEAYKTHHSPQSQLSLLSSTKEIVGLCGNLQKLSSQLAMACTDRRLRVELVAAANRLPTLSQQLKILASVRASAGPSDGDSDRQLVTVAQNLMVVVKDILVKSEAASIRVNQAVVAGNVGLAMIKFRRNLFKGRARRAAAAETEAAKGGTDSAASSKPKATGGGQGLKGLVAGIAAQSGAKASLSSAPVMVDNTGNAQVQTPNAKRVPEPVGQHSNAAATPMKPKASLGSIVSTMKSSPPPTSPPPAAPSTFGGGGDTGAGSGAARDSPSASTTPSPQMAGGGPSLAKHAKSSQVFNAASLLSAPSKAQKQSPSRSGA